MITLLRRRFRRIAVTVLGLLAVSAGICIATPSVAAAAPAVGCEDGSRTSAAAVAKAEPKINEINVKDSTRHDNGQIAATVKLRYSPTYHCAWGLIDGSRGSTVWIDRQPDGASKWDGPLGRRSIEAPNSTTYTAAYTVPGSKVRACGYGIDGSFRNNFPANTVCTDFMTDDQLQAQSGGSGPSATIPDSSQPPAVPSPQNPPQSKVHPAADDGIVLDNGGMFGDSSNISCATGTNDVGVHQGFHDGSPVSIRLCALPNLKSDGWESVGPAQYLIDGANGDALVNSRISGKTLQLIAAAQKAGMALSGASSYRSNEHQAYLYNCYQTNKCNNGALAGRPKYSNHQMGLALDFYIPHASGCAAGDSTSDSSWNSWKWLKQNAAKYGFRQLTAESWHWDTTTSGQVMC